MDECGNFQDSGLQHRMMKLLSNGCWKKGVSELPKIPKSRVIIVHSGSVWFCWQGNHSGVPKSRRIDLIPSLLESNMSNWNFCLPIALSLDPMAAVRPVRPGHLRKLQVLERLTMKGETRRNIAFVAPGMVACFPELGLRWQQNIKNHLGYIMYLAWRYWNVMYNLIPAGFSGVRPKS